MPPRISLSWLVGTCAHEADESEVTHHGPDPETEQPIHEWSRLCDILPHEETAAPFSGIRSRQGRQVVSDPDAKMVKAARLARKNSGATIATQPAQTPELSGKRLSRLLALLTGVLYFLAFPGIDVWPLAFVAWLPLLWALEGKSAREGLFLGWLSGFGMTFLGFYWILHMLKSFSGFSTPICLLFMALLAAYQSGRIASMGWLHVRMVERGCPREAAFLLSFAVSEFLFPLLFPWYFGATVYQVPSLTQVADLGSPIVVGLVLSCVNLVIFDLLRRRRQQLPLALRRQSYLLAPLALALLYGGYRLREVDAGIKLAPHLRVGVVQANMGLVEKRRDREEGLRRHLALSEQLIEQGPLDLLVWSETSVAGGVYEQEAEAVYERLITKRLKTPTLFGALLVRDVSDARRYTLFNSLLMSDRSGKLVGRYDKHKLLPFGEYLPLGDSFPKLYDWSPNTGRFTPGDTLDALKLGDYEVSGQVCYEDVLPSFVNSMFRESPGDLIVNLTNDAWYGDTTQPWIHLALAQFRAIEHRKALVRSTNSGVSAFVDPAGRVTAHTETFTQAALARDVPILRGGRTPYELYGDLPWWACTCLAAYGAFRRRSKLVPTSLA